MIEREMEDLLAAYPEEFFQRQSLTLKGRQQSFSGVGRFDLLFEDQFQTNILMELKARPAKYEDATQLAKYKEELQRRGETNVLMWLTAPHITPSVREFLDRIGIEYSEIHFQEFRLVAQRHGVALESEMSSPVSPPTPPLAGTTAARWQSSAAAKRSPGASGRSGALVQKGPCVTVSAPLCWKAIAHDLVLQNPDAFDKQKFESLIDAFEQSVPSRKNAHLIADLRKWGANPRTRLSHRSCCSLLRWVTTSGWKDAVPHAEAVWAHLFGNPAPSWYVWDQGRREYHFDREGWEVWFESLPQ